MADVPLIDTHCHLDFARNAVELAAAYAACGGALSGTCDPRDFERVRSKLAPYAPHVRVGLGLHPWWVADGTCGEGEVALFERLALGAPLISEVGLDFQPRREGTRDAQIEAFERVCVASARPPAESPRRVMSIHSSAAATCTLDVLERTGCLDACICIFHWFSGSQEELTRVIDAGCLFSMNERMLKTKRGRAYVRAIPEGRLLIETDFPGKPGTTALAADVAPRLERTMSLLAAARGDDERSLALAIAAASERLLLSWRGNRSLKVTSG